MSVRLIFAFLMSITFASPVFAVKNEKECGDVTVVMKGEVTKGKLVIRYLDAQGKFNAVFKFPYAYDGKKSSQETLLSVNPNPMLVNPLWKGIEKCAGGPVVYDSNGKSLGKLKVRAIGDHGDMPLNHQDVEYLSAKFPDIEDIYAIFGNGPRGTNIFLSFKRRGGVVGEAECGIDSNLKTAQAIKVALESCD